MAEGKGRMAEGKGRPANLATGSINTLVGMLTRAVEFVMLGAIQVGYGRWRIVEGEGKVWRLQRFVSKILQRPGKLP